LEGKIPRMGVVRSNGKGWSLYILSFWSVDGERDRDTIKIEEEEEIMIL
jgi:hypothetical protein